MTSTATLEHIFTPKLTYIHNFKILVELEGKYLKEDKISFAQENTVEYFIVYKLHTCSRDLNADFSLKASLFGAVQLTMSTSPGKYYYYEYSIGFDSRSLFSIDIFDFGKNLIIFGVGKSFNKEL